MCHEDTVQTYMHERELFLPLQTRFHLKHRAVLHNFNMKEARVEITYRISRNRMLPENTRHSFHGWNVSYKGDAPYVDAAVYLLMEARCIWGFSTLSILGVCLLLGEMWYSV